jgi:hypothetical protein
MFACQSDFELLKKRIANLENHVGNSHYSMQAIAKEEIYDNSSAIEQAEMQFGMYTAFCIETIDIWKQNRIRWFSPLFHNPKMTVKELPWAHAISPFGGFDDCGVTWVPPAGSTVCIMFENGNRGAPYYIGTTWHRNRGPDGEHTWGVNIEEYYKIWEGKRKGYLVGANDGSQVFPPWNTENYNGYDLNSTVDFDSNPEAQRLITYPNIYGFKTPEKHMIKMVDGDPKCNRKWKRFEIMSSCGNLIMLKDDHLHYAGQWAHTSCGKTIKSGDTSCTDNDGNKKEETSCNGTQSNSKIIGGHPSTGVANTTKYYNSQVGSNPFFKHSQECKPYKTDNKLNTCNLPQSGIQILSISGHTFVMDDSVEEPSGSPTWDREFDFGCNNQYVGRTYWKSATGHMIEMSDVESPQGGEGSQLRGKYNYIRLLSATGNKIELNDHTVSQKDCPGSPPNTAGSERGIHLQTTSNHTIDMVDEGNEQVGICRKDGGIPVAKAKKAYIKIRTGYGLEISLNDTNSQKETDKQNITIFCPQKDNKDSQGKVRGPHIHEYSESKSGPGQVYLRVGGNYRIETYDSYVLTVGNKDNPSDSIQEISRDSVVYTKNNSLQFTEKQHLIEAKENIFLLAGKDCKAKGSDCGGCGDGVEPCFGAVLVYDYCSGAVKISDRVFASSSAKATTLSMFQLSPFVKGKTCG